MGHALGDWPAFRYGRSPSVRQFRKLQIVSERSGELRSLIRARALTASHAADGPILPTPLDRLETLCARSTGTRCMRANGTTRR